MYSVGTPGMWVSFIVFVLIVLFIDMFLLGGKKTHRVSTREAFLWTFTWFVCAMLFCAWLWWMLKGSLGVSLANQKAVEFFTGYLIEESLSIDNMFVFIMIFHYFSVPAEYQRRVLLYGVLGAIVMRLVVILLGTYLISKFHWILYLFGLFLVFTGIKMLFFAGHERDLGDNPLLKWLEKKIRLTKFFHKDHFFIYQNRLWYATPLFLVLVLIEVSDLVFAFDSIPAVFAVTNDPFIVFTSNIFAIMGLRALYFLLAHLAARFHLLKYGIAIMLTFVGAKMLVAPWIKIPIVGTLGVVAAILVTTVLLSIMSKKYKKDKEIKWKS